MQTTNRGKNSADDSLFGSEKMIDKIRSAAQDMNYLLTKCYPEKASSELVGNRYRLRARQIQMLRAASASDFQITERKSKQLNIDKLKGKTIFLDGFNVLILLESLLSGAYIFKGWDGCYRDLSGVHGTYKKVAQTSEAINLVSHFYKNSDAEKIIWVFDQPVSNSGRIKQLITDFSLQEHLNWEIILDHNPDKFLVENAEIVISADAWILDQCKSWFNLIEHIISTENITVNLVKTK